LNRLDDHAIAPAHSSSRAQLLQIEFVMMNLSGTPDAVSVPNSTSLCGSWTGRLRSIRL
jgi:hypothetical protein